MKKWLLVVLAVICIPITLIGCVPTNTPASTTPVVSPITELQNWKVGIDSWKTTTADPAIAKINAQSTTSSNYQSQIDSLNSAVAELKKENLSLVTRITDAENSIKTMGTPVTTGTGVNTGTNIYGQGQAQQFTTGTIPAITTSASGAVVSQINVVSGNLQIASASTATSQPIWYVQRLINYNTAIMYVRPTVQISQSTQYGWNNVAVYVNSTTIAINSVQCSMTVTGSSTNGTIVSIIGNSGTVNANSPSTDTYQMSVSPGLGYQTTSISFQPVKGCGTPSGELYLSPGGYMDITVQISNFTTSQSAFWTVIPSMSYHP